VTYYNFPLITIYTAGGTPRRSICSVNPIRSLGEYSHFSRPSYFMKLDLVILNNSSRFCDVIQILIKSLSNLIKQHELLLFRKPTWEIDVKICDNRKLSKPETKLQYSLKENCKIMDSPTNRLVICTITKQSFVYSRYL